jgi:hypothetical protein
VAELLRLDVAVSEEEALVVWEPLAVRELDGVLVTLVLALVDTDCTSKGEVGR